MPTGTVTYKQADGTPLVVAAFYKPTFDALWDLYAHLPAGQYGPGGVAPWTTLIADLKSGAWAQLVDWNDPALLDRELKVAAVLGWPGIEGRKKVAAVWWEQAGLWKDGKQVKSPSPTILELGRAKLPQQSQAKPANSSTPAPASSSSTSSPAAEMVTYTDGRGVTWQCARFWKATIDALIQLYSKLPPGQFGPSKPEDWAAVWAYAPSMKSPFVAASSTANAYQEAFAGIVAKVLGVKPNDVIAVWQAQAELWAKGSKPGEPSPAILKLGAKLPQASTKQPKPASQANALAPTGEGVPAGSIPWSTIAGVAFGIAGLALLVWAFWPAPKAA